MRNISKTSLALLTVFVMTVSVLLVIPPAGADASRAVVSETAGNNNCFQGFGGTIQQVSAGDEVHGDILKGAQEAGLDDFADCYAVPASAGEVAEITLRVDEFVPGDPGSVNLNMQVGWPNGESWTTNHWDTKFEVGHGLTAVDGWFIVAVVGNFSVDSGGNPVWETAPSDYTLWLNVSVPPTLSKGDHPMAFDRSGAVWHKWFKLDADDATMVRVQNPVGLNMDQTIWGIWDRGMAGDAGYQEYQPFYINRTRVDRTDGNTESAGGRAGDMDLYLHLWCRKGAGTATIKVLDWSGDIPSDGNDVPPDEVQVVDKTTSFLTHIDQSFDHFDWYKFSIKAGEKYTISMNLQEAKSHYYNVSLWDKNLEYIDGWFNTLDGNPYIQPDPQNSDPGNPISTGGIYQPDRVADYTGDYFILVMPIRSMDSGGAFKDDNPSSQLYRLLVELPDYGPVKDKDIDDIYINEDEYYTGLDLTTYFHDQEGEDLSYKIVKKTVGPKITVEKDENEIVTFTPAANWFGECNYTVEATDGDANVGENTLTSDFSVIVEPINDDPTSVGRFANTTIWEGEFYTPTQPLPDLFDDIDDESLVYTYSGNSLIGVNVNPLTYMVNFSTEEFLTFGDATSLWENITFTAKDDSPGSLPASFTTQIEIRHRNHKPTAVRDNYEIEIDEGEVYKNKLKVDELFDDADMTTANDHLVFEVVGIHELSKVDVEIDPVDFELTVTPRNEDYAGEDSFDIEATDEYGSKALVSFHVTIEQVNDPPVLTDWEPDNSTVSLSEGYEKEFSIPGNGVVDPDTPTNEIVYTWYVDGVDQSLSPHVGKNVFTFKTAYNDSDEWRFDKGTYTVKVEVSDGEGTASVEWTVQVLDVNQKPLVESVRIVSPLPGDAFDKGAPIILEAATAIDPDGDELTYDWWDLTTDTLLGSGQTLQLEKMEPGEHKIVVIVTDSVDDSHNVTSEHVTITVKGGGGGGGNQRSPGFEGVFVAVALSVAVLLGAVARRRKD